jgi:hypothetical protein
VWGESEGRSEGRVNRRKRCSWGGFLLTPLTRRGRLSTLMGRRRMLEVGYFPVGRLGDDRRLH